MNNNLKLIGVDLFAGAGGLSLGAEMAGVDVKLAIEKDEYAARTYKANHPNTHVVVDDVTNIDSISINTKGQHAVLFGGPPCQGFSTSNQRTRNKDNPSNWLFKEYIRLVRTWKPEWVVVENVRGIVETEKGLFRDSIVNSLEELGYTCSYKVLNAVNFGVPQERCRFFLIGNRDGISLEIPSISNSRIVTVRDAIEDLPSLKNGASIDLLPYSREAKSEYAKLMRKENILCSGNLVSKNADYVIQRYSYVPQGGNWSSIPGVYMQNYKDRTRCHTGIYRRLCEDMPSITIGNYRKAMLVHPWEDRGLSVREAARLQSFPDSYRFIGSIGFQQQQVGNAVPPLLARAVFETIKMACI